MTTVHEFYEHLDALYEKGDAAGVEAYLTGIANSTYEEGRESDLMLSALNELGSFYRGRSYYEASYAAFMKAKEILDDRGETRAFLMQRFSLILRAQNGWPKITAVPKAFMTRPWRS